MGCDFFFWLAHRKLPIGRVNHPPGVALVACPPVRGPVAMHWRASRQCHPARGGGRGHLPENLVTSAGWSVAVSGPFQGPSPAIVPTHRDWGRDDAGSAFTALLRYCVTTSPVLQHCFFVRCEIFPPNSAVLCALGVVWPCAVCRPPTLPLRPWRPLRLNPGRPRLFLCQMRDFPRPKRRHAARPAFALWATAGLRCASTSGPANQAPPNSRPPLSLRPFVPLRHSTYARRGEVINIKVCT